MRRRRFTEPRLQAIYDECRRWTTAPAFLSVIKAYGSACNNYCIGVWRPDGPARVVRGSGSYAAWAAGVDNARDDALGRARAVECHRPADIQRGAAAQPKEI